MTITQTAAKLGVCRQRVHQLIVAGKLRAVRHGNQWWILEPSIDALIRRPAGRPVSRTQQQPLGGGKG